MTTPLGDLPDWQTFTAPAVQTAALIDQQASLVNPVFASVNPFRVWGVWLRLSVCTSASYVAAILELTADLSDGSSNIILELAVHVTAANQSQHEHATIAVPGWTPKPLGGDYRVNLFSSASAANVFYRCSGGIYYSVP